MIERPLLLKTVEKAFCRRYDRISSSKNDSIIFNPVSDGYKNTRRMIGDIAYCMTVLNLILGDKKNFTRNERIRESMIKNIVKGKHIFTKKAKPATEADNGVVTDLLDTLRANREICVGMAANMIGVNKAIIVVAAGPFQFAMINPVITKKTGAFLTEESCLSLDGARPCTRYKEIEVDYLDSNFKPKHGKYSGFTAQIIQHEVDHCNGVVI